jgi:phosphate acetyltransferase
VTLIEFREKVRNLARKQDLKTILITDGDDQRLHNATRIIDKENIANLVVLSSSKENIQQGKRISLIHPLEVLQNHQDILEQYEWITQKNVNEESIDPSFLGALMLKNNMIDGMVGGSLTPTSSVIRAGLKVIGCKQGISTVSGTMIMDIPNRDQFYYLSDCAVVPRPTCQQLVEIASSTIETALLLEDPNLKVAMLSFSTKGSANHEEVLKVREATLQLKDKYPKIDIDGELQLDVAIDAGVAQKKKIDSPVAGKANILIFPDLNSGNIVCKAIQRFANARATGAIIQGLSKPINDLSRGCNSEDIVDVVAVTAIQANRRREVRVKHEKSC